MTTPGGLSLIIHTLVVIGYRGYEGCARLARFMVGRAKPRPRRAREAPSVFASATSALVAYVIFFTLSTVLFISAGFIVRESWRGYNNWYYLSRGAEVVAQLPWVDELLDRMLPSSFTTPSPDVPTR